MIKQNKSAFTLAELIVVVIIIAILWTIAFISLQKYWIQSRDAKRLSDIQNIKKSLELFSLNTWKFPEADDAISVSFSWDLLWKQWTIWDVVFRNLSKNLNKKPLDPLFDIEYIYSTTSRWNEYEILTISESDLSSSFLINNETYARDNYKVKINWNYNWLFIISNNYLFPSPSILGAFNEDTNMSESGAINSILINDWPNFPYLNIPQTLTKTWELDLNLSQYNAINIKSSDEDKVFALEAIQETFRGTYLQDEKLYNMLLSKNAYEDKLNFVNWILWWNFIKRNNDTWVCNVDWMTINNWETMFMYSEDIIDDSETYDCQSVSQEVLCEDWSLSWDNTYIYTSCVKWIPTNCISNSSYSYNNHIYNIPGLEHWEYLNDLEDLANWENLENMIYLESWEVSENDWDYIYTLNNISCNDWMFINIQESGEPVLISCDFWFTESWWVCVPWWTVDVISWDHIVCPLCE